MTIKSRLLLTIGIITVLCSVWMSVYSYQDQAAQLRNRLANLSDQENNLFRYILDADAEGLRRAVSGLSLLESFRAPLAMGDRDALLQVARPVFDQLKARHAITHMYFITTDGVVLLRLHNPEQFGDRLERATYLQASASREAASGLEMGKNFFSLRCVTPIFADGELLGYLEIAEEIDHIFALMKQISGHDIALFLPRTYIERYETAVQPEGDSDYAVLYPSSDHLRTATSDPTLHNLIRQGNSSFVVGPYRNGGENYIVGASPLRDAFGEVAAVLFSQKTVTGEYAAIWRGVVANLVVFTAILVCGNLLLWLSLKRSMNFFFAIRQHIQEITRTWDIDRQLEVTTSDEIGELAEDINRMQAEIGKLKSSLTHQADELRTANKELEAFNYTVSHDLRTPLTRAYSAASILEENYGDRLDETGRILLDNISKGCEGMEDLIESILGLSNVVRKDLQSEPLDLAALAREIVEELSMAEPGRQVQVVLPESLPCKGDRQLLGVVLRNLIGNAWKFTRKVAEARVELGKAVQQGTPVFFVKDNGVGFNHQQADKLFVPFKRLHDAREYPGSGIGLATVQKIINRHGGTIWGDSKEHEGATFFFTLPEEKS